MHWRACGTTALEVVPCGAWKPSTARRVTQMRLRGIVLNTSVQADRQGPSMTTRWPDCRTRAKAAR